ncbi:uncharacterized protein DUF2612 [Orbus hercynius]|uniref:Uncharacterized protein DUF2612 n=1 Tax=Orbus hercynius TaxID=593135 RepID=A0A495RJK0_9GAMM|nr:DUF2612 domain-containing protein [Orbus hercynius]RKS87346.1 uncharacterized protein DUF2612 [Orbus hercynius]
MNINDTILRQYGNSEKLKNIIYTFNNGMDVTDIVNKFYDNVFNLDTANSYGLDVWARIVDVSRYVKFDSIGEVFGFDGQKLSTFNRGSFYSGEKVTTTLKLADDFFRTVIKSKAAVNISDSSIKDINRILGSIFNSDIKPFVTDNLDMSMHYVFPFYLRDNEISLIKNSNILPRPSGVKLRGIITIPNQVFGFFGSNCQTFNNGTFISQRGIIDVN